MKKIIWKVLLIILGVIILLGIIGCIYFITNKDDKYAKNEDLSSETLDEDLNENNDLDNEEDILKVRKEKMKSLALKIKQIIEKDMKGYKVDSFDLNKITSYIEEENKNDGDFFELEEVIKSSLAEHLNGLKIDMFMDDAKWYANYILTQENIEYLKNLDISDLKFKGNPNAVIRFCDLDELAKLIKEEATLPENEKEVEKILTLLNEVKDYDVIEMGSKLICFSYGVNNLNEINYDDVNNHKVISSNEFLNLFVKECFDSIYSLGYVDLPIDSEFINLREMYEFYKDVYEEKDLGKNLKFDASIDEYFELENYDQRVDNKDGKRFGSTSNWGDCNGQYQTIYNLKASSTLANDGIPEGYDVKNILAIGNDNPRDNTWAEGAPGSGIGEYIEFYVSQDYTPGCSLFCSAITCKNLWICNGYCKNEKTWTENNRVKKMKLYVNDKEVGIINLKDTDRPQKIDISKAHIYKNFLKDPHIKLEIVEVYRGTVYDDTCITGVDIY